MANPILVTGTHSSGSTWVGRMLSLSNDIGYIHEPFNPEKGICQNIFKYWYTYVNEKNESIYKEEIKRCLDFKYSIFEEVKSASSLKDIARISRDKFIFLSNKLQQRRPLIKDPISLLSAEWLYKTFNMEVIIVIRHPAAFVGSLKKGNATFPFDHLLSQEHLMKDHLSEYDEIIRKYAYEPPDIIDQAILLWNLFHEMILKYRNTHSNWLFYRHEDLSREPVEKFGEIYSKLGLDYSSSITKKIKEHSSAKPDERTHLKRNSQSNVWRWKQRLTKREIDRIRKDTLEIAESFYSLEDWYK